MCAIAGFLAHGRRVGPDECAIVREMTRRMAHRGPDGDGFYEDEHVALGMRRLAIIDPNGGHQPIRNETGDIALVCNGEIYNYAALANQLRARGHTIRSRCDVETIVHGYEDDGALVLQRLRGMYALALWDARQRTLLLARDPLGEKPLFLYRDSRGLWFASEASALLPAIRQPQINARALYLYLTFQYVIEPDSFFDGVQALPPGHHLTLKPGDTSQHPVAHWRLLDIPAATGDAIDTVRTLLPEACRLMGTADVPVGVALSGGIDSSLVATLAAEAFPGRLTAFTIGYSGRPGTDERQLAAECANGLGLAFKEVELSQEELVRDFPHMIQAIDQPIADPAAYGYYAVARAARAAGVPVLLSGLGGDEIFWGYDWVRDAARCRMPTSTDDSNRRRLWRWWPTARRPVPQPMFAVHAELAGAQKLARNLFPATAQLPPDEWLRCSAVPEGAQGDLAVMDTLNRTWLMCNCLALGDRVTMAHGIEMHLPFLDRALIERVVALRRGGLDDSSRPHKALLLDAFGKRLPPAITARQKQGFTPPVTEWMRALSRAYGHLVSGGCLIGMGLMQADQWQSLQGAINPFTRHKLISLELWLRTTLAGESAHKLAATTRNP